MAAKRWEGHVSKAEARLIIRGLVELEIERTVAQVSQFLPPPEEMSLDDWEPWEEEDEPPEPVEPFYTEQSLRERMKRKAEREKRKKATE